VQEKYQDLMNHPDHLLQVMASNAERAREVAKSTRDQVYQALGLVQA
jgi:hypothetical protein